MAWNRLRRSVSESETSDGVRSVVGIGEREIGEREIGEREDSANAETELREDTIFSAILLEGKQRLLDKKKH